MLLADIVKDLKGQVQKMSDFGYNQNQKVSYDLIGRIIIESKEIWLTEYVLVGSRGTKAVDERSVLESIYFEGRLTYITETGSGKMSASPIKNPEARRDFIIAMLQEFTEEDFYKFEYDEKEDRIIISSSKNLEEELGRIAEVFGVPTRKEYKI